MRLMQTRNSISTTLEPVSSKRAPLASSVDPITGTEQRFIHTGPIWSCARRRRGHYRSMRAPLDKLDINMWTDMELEEHSPTRRVVVVVPPEGQSVCVFVCGRVCIGKTTAGPCACVCVVLSSLIRRRISLIRIYQKLVIFEETSPTFSRGACQLGGGVTSLPVSLRGRCWQTRGASVRTQRSQRHRPVTGNYSRCECFDASVMIKSKISAASGSPVEPACLVLEVRGRNLFCWMTFKFTIL